MVYLSYTSKRPDAIQAECLLTSHFFCHGSGISGAQPRHERFDSLPVGENYLNAKPVIQIGLLNYTLFPEFPEFYAVYEFRNAKNHRLYSNKLRLCVLDLSRIDLATSENKLYRTDYWTSLFKSTTWEEIKMLAKYNASISVAASTVYRLSHEELIRLQCEARKDYYRTQNDLKQVADRWKTSATKLASEIEALIADKNRLLAIMAEHRIQPE